MEKENVYEAPQSDIRVGEGGENTLASRWARLGASLLDTIILMIILVPALFLQGFYEKVFDGIEPSMMDSIIAGLLGIVIFFVINLNFIMKSGQTIGKKIVGIKMVDINNDEVNLTKNIIPRYAVYFLPAQIPLVGSVFSLINILFIFGAEKRCVHDFAGRTKVVKV